MGTFLMLPAYIVEALYRLFSSDITQGFIFFADRQLRIGNLRTESSFHLHVFEGLQVLNINLQIFNSGLHINDQ